MCSRAAVSFHCQVKPKTKIKSYFFSIKVYGRVQVGWLVIKLRCVSVECHCYRPMDSVFQQGIIKRFFFFFNNSLISVSYSAIKIQPSV